MSTEPGAASWVTVVDGPATREGLETAVGRLRSMFAETGAELQIEYNEAAAPRLGPWLEEAGLRLTERNPLMACRATGFKPFTAADVALTRLGPASSESELLAFQEIRWTDGGESDGPVPPVERLQRELASPAGVYLLGWVGGHPAGTGVSHALKGAAEIVGVVTVLASRRRGVAATISSELVSRHFASGGDFVFLDAATEDAARVYERLGFTRFGANLVYR